MYSRRLALRLGGLVLFLTYISCIVVNDRSVALVVETEEGSGSFIHLNRETCQRRHS